MNPSRREFLKRSGWVALGSLLVPYVPVFYSIPAPVFPRVITVKDILKMKFMLEERHNMNSVGLVACREYPYPNFLEAA